MTRARQRTGRDGERRAAEVYEARGYRVLDRNWRCERGEIDLVLAAPDETTVVFCEVKARSSDRYGTPFEAVTAAKARRVRALAARWLSEHPGGRGRRPVRFDTAGVRGADVEIREGVF